MIKAEAHRPPPRTRRVFMQCSSQLLLMFSRGKCETPVQSRTTLLPFSSLVGYVSPQPKGTMKHFVAIIAIALSLVAARAKDWVEYDGKSGPGQGKHIVFLAGDEEYRSEEGLPQLAK